MCLYGRLAGNKYVTPAVPAIAELLVLISAARCYASAPYAACVCVSVTFVHSVETNKYVFAIFSPSGSHTILVFPYQTAWQYSDGTPPLTGASNAGGVGRNRDSEPISGFTHALKRSSGKCNTLSCDRPWRLYNTSRW